ncbi:MAG: Nramp family divalent metal transporter [Coriobacteriales bacterium]|nr:Nramp family divalent metal transporter [Coriobacteriales bacterium]
MSASKENKVKVFDSSEINSVDFNQKSSFKNKKIYLILAALGPGIIAAMAGNDAGGISTYSTIAAKFGYATLWIIPIMCIMLIIVQECAARVGVATGKGLSSNIRERFGIRPTVIAMSALLVENLCVTLSEFAGIAAGMQLFGVSKLISVPIAAVAVWVLVMGGNYKRVEKVFLIISCVFVTYLISAVMAGPNWSEVGFNTICPHFIGTPEFVSLVVATIGTTIAPWMIFLTQNNVVDKGVEKEELKYERIDVIAGSIVACMVAAAIIITTATVLFPQGIEVESAESAAIALEPIAGNFASILFGVGLVAASFLAACVLPLVGSSAICEAFGWERGVDTKFKDAPIFKSMYTFIIIFGVAISLIPNVNLVQIMLFAQFVSGILLPVILIFLVKISSNEFIMGPLKNHPILNIAMYALIVVIIALTITYFVLTLLGI